MPFILNLILIIFLLAFQQGCLPDRKTVVKKTKGCKRCHSVKIDDVHNFKCTFCHDGDPEGWTAEQAHSGLVYKPSHPSFMDKRCGKCHPEHTVKAKNSVHFTLKNEINTVWRAFFSTPPPEKLLTSSLVNYPETAEELITDLMKKRCLRCHVYYSGDDYSSIKRGTGCAACHMKFEKGRLSDHRFLETPEDIQCLACHYANFIGWDFYGRYEQDSLSEFNTPLVEGKPPSPSYGINWHNMDKDIHKKAGFSCIYCHIQLCGDKQNHHVSRPSCYKCHKKIGLFDENIAGHDIKDRKIVDCTVCHAQWSFNDFGRSLVRQDAPDWEDWGNKKNNGSSEVERQIEANLKLSFDLWSKSVMQDKFFFDNIINSYTEYPGIWFSGFTKRRWFPLTIGESEGGRLYVVRPILDIAVSYVNSEDEILFDNIKPDIKNIRFMKDNIVSLFNHSDELDSKPAPWLWRPYHPHTTGKPDFFRTQAVIKWLERFH